MLAGRGVTQANDLLVAYQATLASLDAAWNLHSEMLNMGYAAYLNFLMIGEGALPRDPDQTVAQMVSGVDVLLFRPDDELKRLAAHGDRARRGRRRRGCGDRLRRRCSAEL